MAFCGKCGTPLDGGNFCPNCGAPVRFDQSRTIVNATSKLPNKAGRRKKAIIGISIVMVVFFVVTRFTAMVDEPCDWCRSRPSAAYKMSDGSYSYVCRDCSKECAWCGDKATKHYENLAGMMVFACDDCYEEISGD